MKRLIARIVVLFVCVALICPLMQSEGFADDYSLVDKTELEALMEDFISSHGIDGRNISIGYCYTGTGERWYYNQDSWYYAGSMYKVPLMMLVSEKVKSGELTQETEIQGMSLAEMEELILVYSNNEWAHVMRNYMGGDAVWREQSKKYSSIKDEDYDPDFVDYGYVNPVYVIDVFETLYKDPDSYPNIHDMLLLATPNQYLRKNIEGQYQVAQKYGALNEFYHIGGIIYTPNPIIVTVMTQHMYNVDQLMGDAAEMLVNYSLGLDEQLEKLKAEPVEEIPQSVEPVVTQAPQASAAPVIEHEEPEQDSRTADSLAKIAAYISLPCFVFAFILAIINGVENRRRKLRRRQAASHAQSGCRRR